MKSGSEHPAMPYPTPAEIERGFAAHLRQDPEFQRAVGHPVHLLADEDILVLYDIVTTPPQETTNE